jgi:tetratricopeptide (TPR) repeat protein
MKTTTTVIALAGVLLVAGCPGRTGVAPQTAATVKASELPSDAPSLLTYIDGELAKVTRAANENALVAVEKLRAKQPGNFEASWRGARACAFLVEEFTEKSNRIYFAERGVFYAQATITADPQRVEGHYWLGINQGLLAQSKHGIRLASHVRASAERAIKLDEKYDYAGPLRLLGTFYAQAPPELSKGDPEQGVKLLTRAVELSPEYPQNVLHLADALVKDDKFDEAKRRYEEVLQAPDDPRWGKRLGEWKADAKAGLKEIMQRRGGASPFLN